MNIWALDKDLSIKHLLLLLEEVLSGYSYQIINSDNIDKRAIRLSIPDDSTTTVYIFTYGQEPDKYGVHLEYTEEPNQYLNNTVEVYDNMSFDHLVQLLKVQFIQSVC